METLYKILFRDNVNQRFVTLLNQDENLYNKNLKKLLEAQDDLKCNIIFNGITNNTEDLKHLYKEV
jgi:hypothetical protein